MRWIEFGAKSDNGFFTRNHKIYNGDDLTCLIHKYNNTDCYTSIYSYDEPEPSNSNLLGDYCIDFDSPLNNNDDYTSLVKEVKMAINYLKYEFKIDESNILIFYSGAKGFHIVVPHQIFNIIPCKQLNIIYKYLTNTIIKNGVLKYCDLKIYDNRRLFRIPNTINSKTGLYKINISIKELESLSLKDMQDIARAPRSIPATNASRIYTAEKVFNVFKETVLTDLNVDKHKEKPKEFKKPDQLYIPHCIEEIMNNGAVEGIRNNSLAFLSSFFLQNGYTLDETLSILDMWNKSFNDKEIEAHEFDATVRSIFKNKHIYGCQMGKSVSSCSPNCKFYHKKTEKFA